MARERRQFTREVKSEAIRLVVEEKRPAAQVARELDIGRNLLRRWKDEIQAEGAEAFPGHGKPTSQDAEIRRLLRGIPWNRPLVVEAVLRWSTWRHRHQAQAKGSPYRHRRRLRRNGLQVQL